MKEKSHKTRIDKPLRSKRQRRIHSEESVEFVSLRYKFRILIGVLVLAGLSIIMHIESPTVWTFLYGIGGWAALTTNPRRRTR